MLVTVSTIAQLPQALTLGSSFRQHHPDQPFVIGLADDPAHLPANWQSPYPMLTLTDAGFSATELGTLSARYTPTEFRAAVKPAFIRAAFDRFFQPGLLYADPSAFVYAPLTAFFERLAMHSLLLNPHRLTPPQDNRQPDEKHLQNIGLFSSGFIGFGRQPETKRMLDWWHDRVQQHARLDFCAGQCLDQLWLMHVPTFFDGVGLLKEPGLQLALWNVPERPLQHTPQGWQVTHNGQTSPLLTADVLGLLSINEGLFQDQTRLTLPYPAPLQRLLTDYKQALRPHQQPGLANQPPAYGQQPEPVVPRGWRRQASQTLGKLSRWIDTVPLRPLHR